MSIIRYSDRRLGMNDFHDRRQFLAASVSVAIAGAATADDKEDRRKAERLRLSLYLASTFDCRPCAAKLDQMGRNDIDGFPSVNDAGNALENAMLGVWESDPARVVSVLRKLSDSSMLSDCERDLVKGLWAVAELIIAARGQCVVFTHALKVLDVKLDQARLARGIDWVGRWVSCLGLDAMMVQILTQIKTGIAVCEKNYDPGLTFKAYGPAYLSAAKLVDVFDLLGLELSRLLLQFALDEGYKCQVRAFDELLYEALAKLVPPGKMTKRDRVKELWCANLGPTVKQLAFRLANVTPQK